MWSARPSWTACHSVTRRRSRRTDIDEELLATPAAPSAGTCLGPVILKATQARGRFSGLAAASGVYGFHVTAGADVDAGWRGFALPFGTSVLPYKLVVLWW